MSFSMQGLKIRKQRSTGDLEKRGTGGSIRSNASSASWMSTESSQSQASASVHTDSNASFVIEVGLRYSFLSQPPPGDSTRS